MIRAWSDPDVFNLGSDLKSSGSALNFQVLGELYGVARVELVSVSITENESFGCRRCFFGRPFVSTIGAGEKVFRFRMRIPNCTRGSWGWST